MAKREKKESRMKVVVGGWFVGYQTIWRGSKAPAIDIYALAYEQWTRISPQINGATQFQLSDSSELNIYIIRFQSAREQTFCKKGCSQNILFAL